MARKSVEKRDYRFNLQLSQSEREILLASAAAVGLNASDYMRYTALRQKLPGTITDVAADTYEELRRIGTNINQIARAANKAVKAGHPVEVDMELLEELRQLILETKHSIRHGGDED